MITNRVQRPIRLDLRGLPDQEFWRTVHRGSGASSATRTGSQEADTCIDCRILG